MVCHYIICLIPSMSYIHSRSSESFPEPERPTLPSTEYQQSNTTVLTHCLILSAKFEHDQSSDSQ